MSITGARTILIVFGTRPEVIKLAPVVRALREHGGARVVTCSTGQHREMLAEALAAFELEADHDLELMRANQNLSALLGRMSAALPEVLEQVKPDVVVVQGDTLTVMGTALCSFLGGYEVAHVEAGLRTRDKRAPFPEEVSRRVAGVVADRHFAPTPGARDALLRENVPEESIWVTGNTGIDAVMWMRDRVLEGRVEPPIRTDRRLVLVTAHRRESFGGAFREVCLSLRDLALKFEDIELVYPVHLNPNVQDPVREILGDVPRVHLLPPVPYPQLASLLVSAELVITDSGGIQEEAPTLGKPVLVLREKTERPEAVGVGLAILVGTDRERIVGEASRLLSDADALEAMSRPTPVYGDGLASRRIAEQLIEGRMGTAEFQGWDAAGNQ